MPEPEAEFPRSIGYCPHGVIAETGYECIDCNPYVTKTGRVLSDEDITTFSEEAPSDIENFVERINDRFNTIAAIKAERLVREAEDDVDAAHTQLEYCYDVLAMRQEALFRLTRR